MKKLQLRSGSSRRASIVLAIVGFSAACGDASALAPDGSYTNNASSVKKTPPPPPPTTSGSLAGALLYVRTSSPAMDQANAWRTSRPSDAALMDRIASQSVATWLGGWSGDVRTSAHAVVVAAAGRVPVFVAYNIPNRDCGSYSAGGALTAAGYKSWIREVAAGVGSGSVVILEPDAISGMDCLSSAMQDDRIALLADAITVLKGVGAIVYLDAGHARWLSVATAVARLKLAGIDKADGFSLNVSNFILNDESIRYGEQISSQVGGKHYVIDTSRNGNGPISADAWCNPRGRALGALPTTNTGQSHVDAFLWVKVPGESDGSCNGGPSAGSWWADYALELARNQPLAFIAQVSNTMKSYFA